MKEYIIKNIDGELHVCRGEEIIGKVSEKAKKWVAEGEQFDEGDIVAQPGAMSIRKPIKKWHPAHMVDVRILFKCPECGNFR